jgi:hypothetical protein
MPKHTLIHGAGAIACLVAFGGSVASAASPGPSVGAGASAGPVIDPADFGPVVDNPWYPLIPGTVLRYRGAKDGQQTNETFEVTQEHPVIDGVTCVEVLDTVRIHGRVDERTRDWYAQDLAGNVWYFGEDTATYDAQGKVLSRDGTWQSGVDGAEPGVFMPADPTIGQSFQQEFLPGQAEDHFVVTQVGVPVEVPFGSFPDALLTIEWTPLEPDVVTQKAYVRGIGEVSEADLTGSNEHLELLRVQGPGA